MKISREYGMLEEVINKHKKNLFNNEDDNIAGMFAIKEIMSFPKNEQINFLGESALDILSYRANFEKEASMYGKYLEIISNNDYMTWGLAYVKSLSKNSDIIKKLISLRVLDDMGLLKERQISPISIYDLAFSEYIEREDFNVRDFLRHSLSKLLSGNSNYAYSILGDVYLEAVSMKRKMKEKDYSFLFPSILKLDSFLSEMSKEELNQEFERASELYDYEYFLNIISEAIIDKHLDIKILDKKVSDYYTF